ACTGVSVLREEPHGCTRGLERKPIRVTLGTASKVSSTSLPVRPSTLIAIPVTLPPGLPRWPASRARSPTTRFSPSGTPPTAAARPEPSPASLAHRCTPQRDRQAFPRSNPVRSPAATADAHQDGREARSTFDRSDARRHRRPAGDREHARLRLGENRARFQRL